MIICPLWGPLSSLRPSVSSTALCPLYGILFPLRPSVPSMVLCPLYGPLSPLWPPVPSEKQRNKRNDPLVSQNVLHNVIRQNSKGYCDLFRLSDNRDYLNDHDYHSSKILSDNHKIAIIALAKKSCNNRNNHIQQGAIIVFQEKLKMPFRISPSCNPLWNCFPFSGDCWITVKCNTSQPHPRLRFQNTGISACVLE